MNQKTITTTIKKGLIGIYLLANTLFCQGNNSTKQEYPLQPQQATWKTIFQKHLIKTTVGSLISIAGIILLYRRNKSGNDTIENSDTNTSTHKTVRKSHLTLESVNDISKTVGSSDTDTSTHKNIRKPDSILDTANNNSKNVRNPHSPVEAVNDNTEEKTKNKKEVKQLLKQLENPNLKEYKTVLEQLAYLLNKQSTKDLNNIRPVMKFIEDQTKENRRTAAFASLEGIIFTDNTIETWLIKMLKDSINKFLLKNIHFPDDHEQIKYIIKNLSRINPNKAVGILKKTIKEQNPKKQQDILIILLSELRLLKENSGLISLFQECQEPNIRSLIMSFINIKSEDTTIQNQLQKLLDKEQKSSVKASILQKIYKYKFLHSDNIDKSLNEFISTFENNKDEPIRIGLVSIFNSIKKIKSIKLKNIKHKEIGKLLKKTATNKLFSSKLRIAAINALYSFKNRNLTALIMNHLIKDNNKEISSKGISLLDLNVFKEEEMINSHLESLIDLIQNDSPINAVNKKFIINALKKSKDKKSISALENVQKNGDDEAVRNAAKSVLDEMKQEVKQLLEQLEDPNLKEYKIVLKQLAKLLNKQSTINLDNINLLKKFIKAQTREMRKVSAFELLKDIILFPNDYIEDCLIKMLRESTNKSQNATEFYLKTRIPKIVVILNKINHNKAVDILKEIIKKQDRKKNQSILIIFIQALGLLKENSSLITLLKEYESPKIRIEIIKSINIASEDTTTQKQLAKLLEEEKSPTVKETIVLKLYEYKFLPSSIFTISKFASFIDSLKSSVDNTTRIDLINSLEEIAKDLEDTEFDQIKSLLRKTAINQSYSAELRLDALDVLSDLKNSNLADLIISHLIKDTNEWIREESIDFLTLEHLKEEDKKKWTLILKNIEKNDASEKVRNAAKSALDEMNSKK